MLRSEEEERARKFTLAMRAGIPVFILIGLVIYGTFFQNENLHWGLRESLITAGLIFVTTYFIFFLLEEDGQKSLVDQVTGSYNYPAFLKYYRDKRPASLGILLIKNFEIINENYGIDEINTMLKTLVFQLDAMLQAEGIDRAVIGRREGEEFIIGAPAGTSRLRKAIETFSSNLPVIRDIELDYRYAVIGEPEDALEKTLWHLHDMILSQSENTEEEPKPPANPIEKIQFGEQEQAIVEAIQNRRITFSFRPLLQVKSEEVDTYELSVTLRMPDGSTLLPRIYLPVVNRLGFGREYDRAILDHVLEILPLLDAKTAFSFNLSPFSLRNSEFQSFAFEKIAQSGIDPSRLIIELYERKTHHNLEGYLKTLSAFRARGVRICIDNFGSSNASMEYMRHFKFDMVQFDRDFVGKLDDQNTHAMLRSLVEMSRSLGITTVAKWVDKPEQKATLIAMGIDYLQGFGIGKPLSEEQIINRYN